MLFAILILAVVEGLTEFIPVSSTGHLVVAASLLKFAPVWREPFIVVIQLGAITAVVVDRWSSLTAIVRNGEAVRFCTLLFLGFFPSAVLGLLLHDTISRLLRTPAWVSVAWIAGGVAILVLDRGRGAAAERSRGGVDVPELPRVTSKQALLIGLAQCLSLWPGVSRSASTILGGLAVGLDRTTATLLSFYLAIPTMAAASVYELLKFRATLTEAGASLVAGTIVSFVIAWATVRWLLRYVQTHTFRPFAVYRMVAGAMILLLPAEWWT